MNFVVRNCKPIFKSDTLHMLQSKPFFHHIQVFRFLYCVSKAFSSPLQDSSSPNINSPKIFDTGLRPSTKSEQSQEGQVKLDKFVSSFIFAGFFFNNFSYRICFSSSWSTGENNLFVFHGFFYLFGKVHIVVFLFVFLNLQIILFVAFLTTFVTFQH